MGEMGGKGGAMGLNSIGFLINQELSVAVRIPTRLDSHVFILPLVLAQVLAQVLELVPVQVLTQVLVLELAQE